MRDVTSSPEEDEVSIDGCFSGPLPEPMVLRECSKPAPMMEKRSLADAEPAMKMSVQAAKPRKSRPGRLGTIFRLNRKKYDEMKGDGLKQEF